MSLSVFRLRHWGSMVRPLLISLRSFLTTLTNSTVELTQLKIDNAVLKGQISELQDLLSTKPCNMKAVAKEFVLQTRRRVVLRRTSMQSTSKGEEFECIKKLQDYNSYHPEAYGCERISWIPCYRKNGLC